MPRLRLNDNDNTHPIVYKWVRERAVKQKETREINQWNEKKPVLPDKPRGSTRRGMKWDGARRAMDVAARPTCDNLSERRAGS